MIIKIRWAMVHFEQRNDQIMHSEIINKTHMKTEKITNNSNLVRIEEI
jgi:hypothetical protein